MIRRRTILLFLRVNGVKCFWFALLWLVLISPVAMLSLPFSLPEWSEWPVAGGMVVSSIGMVLILQVIHARRVTGSASLILLWEFWMIDPVYRKLPRAAQEVAFKKHFGKLNPVEVASICRGEVERHRRR